MTQHFNELPPKKVRLQKILTTNIKFVIFFVDRQIKNYIIRNTFFKASVVELVDTTDSKSVAERRGGSSPPTGTNIKSPDL